MSIQRDNHPAARCALYARTAAGGSKAIESQLALTKAAVAGREGATVVGEYRDVNVSGAGAAGPGLAALLAEVATGGVDLVVVTGLGRLGRSVRGLNDTLAAIERGGARVLTVEKG